MLKLNDAGYDESLDTMTIIQLYKTYDRTTLLYGLENLNLNIGETDRVSAFEKAIIKTQQNHNKTKLLRFCCDFVVIFL